MGLILLSACGASFGEKYERGNLEIFYTEDTENFVIPLADYFEENDMIFDHKHSVHLSSKTLGEGGGFKLKMVANKDKKIPNEDLNANLDALARSLSTNVFYGGEVEVIMCDENFEPIQ